RQHERERESSRGAEAQQRRIDGQIEIAGCAKNLDRGEQREKNQKKIDIDRSRRGGRSHAASEQKDGGENTSSERQPVSAREPQHTESVMERRRSTGAPPPATHPPTAAVRRPDPAGLKSGTNRRTYCRLP